jgi:hypothetical protein
VLVSANTLLCDASMIFKRAGCVHHMLESTCTIGGYSNRMGGVQTGVDTQPAHYFTTPFKSSI